MRGLSKNMGEYIPIDTINEIPGLVKAISDNGISLVISAIVMIVLSKVFTIMLNQNSSTLNTVIPKLDEIIKKLDSMMITININNTNSAITISKRFCELNDSMEKLVGSISEIDDKLNTIIKTQNKLAERTQKIENYIEVQTMYNQTVKK